MRFRISDLPHFFNNCAKFGFSAERKKRTRERRATGQNPRKNLKFCPATPYPRG